MNGVIQKKIVNKNIDGMKTANNQSIRFLKSHLNSYSDDFMPNEVEQIETLVKHLSQMNVFFEMLRK